MWSARSNHLTDVLITEKKASDSPITLEQMLARRDDRQAQQQRLLHRFDHALTQLTLVNPGPVKDTQQARFVFDEGLRAVRQTLKTASCAVLASESDYFVTGPEAMLVVSADARVIKQHMVALEAEHPLGRLWDIDVIGADGIGISRQQLNLPARHCLVCEQPAHVCSRSGQHMLTEVQRAIKDKIDAYCSDTEN